MNLTPHLDHTLLKPDCTPDQIRLLCQEAKEYQFASVCVPPCYVALAAQELNGTGVAVGTVIGFPLGYQDTRVKYREAEIAIEAGATELDMVLNLAWLKAGLVGQVEEEIEDLADLARVHDTLLKVIIETALLTETEIVQAAQLCVEAGASFVKTSTGFANRGASVADVELLRANLPATMRIKASGGIRTRAAALALLAAGADRIGSSNSVALLREDDQIADETASV